MIETARPHRVGIPTVLLILAAAALAVPGYAAAPEAPAAADSLPPLRRVILISCDTLSAHHLAACRDGGVAAAAFDSLATAGVLFRSCTTPQVWTLTAHMSMLTGLPPGVHRVGAERGLPADIPLLAQPLHDAGWATGGFATANQWLDARFGFDRGFQDYRSFPFHSQSVEWVAAWMRNQVRFLHGPRSPSRPYFLFLHFMDVHTQELGAPYPYWPRLRRVREAHGLPERMPLMIIPEPGAQKRKGRLSGEWDMRAYDADFLRNSYDACIESWDASRLLRTLALLRKSGHLRDTLVIVTADHGEEFDEHGGFLHAQPYAEIREVPLLFVWPGRLPAGRTVDARVSLLDLAPTILDLAQLPPLPGAAGRSLRPLLLDADAPWPDRDFLIDGHCRQQELEPSALVAREEGRWWSLVATTDTTGCAGAYVPGRADSVLALYDLDADPRETTDVSAAHPGVVAALRLRLDEQLAVQAAEAESLATGGIEDEVVLTPEDRRKLHALGY